MASVTVPFAPLAYQLPAGAALLVACLATLRWGWNNLRLSLRMLKGAAPLPPGSSAPFVMVGVAVSLASLALGMFLAFFLLALLTTQPTRVSDNGVVVGARPPLYRARTIGWAQVSQVTCNLPPRGDRIRTITVRAGSSSVELGDAGAALEDVRAIALAKAPPGSVQPCVHGALDHSWSY